MRYVDTIDLSGSKRPRLTSFIYRLTPFWTFLVCIFRVAIQVFTLELPDLDPQLVESSLARAAAAGTRIFL